MTLDSVDDGIRRVRCLIVDDNLRFLETACRVLGQDGITVIGVATNSEDALRLVAELRPDVTLIDIALGNEYGFDLIEQIESSGLGKIPLMVCMSTHAVEDYAEVVESSAAVGYLSKERLCRDAIHDIVRSNRGGSGGPGVATALWAS